MHAHINVELIQANYMHTSHRHKTLTPYRLQAAHVYVFNVHSGCVSMHASSICSVHDGIIHAWACVCETT
jgi:hypothetical protein